MFSPIGPGDVWSVGDLTEYIRELFELDFRLQDLSVEGEVSNFTRARSGHLYFTLKDDRSQIRCVMWRSSAESMLRLPQDGDAVVVSGRVSVYDAGGVYQLYATRIEPAGRGDLAQAFEELKQKLDSEGLFDAGHKKALPPFPNKIGIVTSLDAAALRDILTVLRRRWPLVSVLIAPALVQGSQAPEQIARALHWLDGRNDIDVLIIARGGGSIEDLWAFNDEELARAIFEARRPTIVGVGHETDFTIADFVADVRAPTPSAAAELAVPDRADIAGQLVVLRAALSRALQERVARKGSELQLLLSSLKHLSPRAIIDGNRQKVDWLNLRLEGAIGDVIEQKRNRLAVAQVAIRTIGPLATLERGYAIVRDGQGRVVRSKDQVTTGERLRIRVADGDFGARVD